MARLPRLTVPGFPHHIVQRGNNRQAIFVDVADYETMLELLVEQSKKFQVAVHAYVLMGNHFHLLATPETAEGLPLMMQAVGRSYVRYFNNRHGRSGTLWEGRYRSTVLEAERYLVDCMVSIDLNHSPASSTIDSLETAVLEGKLVRVVSWYDNEWGFSNRMVDTAAAMAKLG